jgi:hypothetical protein
MNYKTKYAAIMIGAFYIAYALPSTASTLVADIAFINGYVYSILIVILILIVVVWIKLDQLIRAINAQNDEKKD